MSKLLQFIRFIILPIIIFMAENPYNKVVSNFSTYIPDSILKKLPHFIQDKNFDRTITIIAIVLILISFIPFKKLFTKIKSYKDRKILNISRINKGIKNPNFISLHDAIAKIVEQLDVKQLYKDYKFDDHTIYPYLKYKQCSSLELFVIFTFILEEKLILYAHKIIYSGQNRINTTHLSLQRIPKDFLTTKL